MLDITAHLVISIDEARVYHSKIATYDHESLTSCGEATKSPMDTKLYIDSVWALVHPNNLALALTFTWGFAAKVFLYYVKKVSPVYECVRKLHHDL